MPTLSLMEIMEEAYERVQIDPRAGYDFRSAKRSLNILLSEWTNRGLNLWIVQEQIVPSPAGNNEFIFINDTIYDVMDAVYRDTSQGQPFDRALDRISPTDWLNIPFKTMVGSPSQFTVMKTATSMTIKIWQVPDRDGFLVLNVLTQLDPLTGYASSVPIPARFQAAMISGLAHQLALKRNPSRAPELKAYYEEDYQRAADEERDRSSFFVAPDIRR